MEEQNKRKATILMIVGVITLIGLVVGATYAYFASQVGTGDKAQINAKAGTTDDLTFATTGPITITANQTNFAQGEESLSDSATATAHLIAGDDDNIATEHYYLYLQIDANNLTYTVGKDQPELIMEITDPNEQPYTEPIEGLEYKTEITDGKGVTYSGYDITEAKGLFAIAKEYEITASNDKTDTWTIKVTFLNLDTDQHENTDKTLTGKLIIQKEEKTIPIQDKLLADANKDDKKTLYHHNGTIKMPSTISDLENEAIIEYGYKVADNYKEEYSQIKDDLIKRSCNGQDVNVDDYDENCEDEEYNDISKYYLDYKGNQTLYDTYRKALQQAINDKYVEPDASDANDDSYRYAGASNIVNNYVCLDGTTENGECESDADLYRIIGLFKNNEDKYEMKLIKYDYATSTQLGETGAYSGIYNNEYDDGSDYKGSQDNLTNIGGYYWYYLISEEDYDVNEWAGSALRETNLNDYYLNTYLKEIKRIDIDNLIEIHTWSLNGHDENEVTPKVMYDNEMNKVESSPEYSTKTKTIENKIGLMYASDYGYAASPSITNNWVKTLGDYDTGNISDNNWMYMGLSEWTISRLSATNDFVFDVFHSGNIHSDFYATLKHNPYAVRPSFYLSSGVKIKSGEGTKERPYRLEI